MLKKLRPVIDVIVPFARILRRAESDPKDVSLKLVLGYAIPQSFLFMWLASFIPFVGGLVYSLLLVPLAAYIHIAEFNIEKRSAKAATLLWYFTVIIIGFGGVWGFVGHTALADSVAQSIGWATGSQFQIELAFYHLGFGVAALMTIWIRDQLITGLVIAKSIFWYGAALVHINDAITESNFAIYNVGPPLIGDIVIPTILLWLLYVSLKQR